MKIAITGASGFIGKYIVDHFVQKEAEVVVIGRSKERLDRCFADNVLKYESDYSLKSLTNILEDIDVVIHLAATLLSRDTHPFKLSQFFEGNLLATEKLFLAAQQNRISRICQTSSINVYSNSNKLPFSEDEPPVPANIYGVSKLACEHLADLFSTRTDLKITTLRLARLFGYGEREGLVFMKYMSLAKQKLPLEIWGTGTTSIDYIYIKDVVSAIEKAIKADAPHGTFNIGSGRSYSVNEIAETINQIFDNTGNIEFDTSKKEGGFNIYMDCSKAHKFLDWKPVWILTDAIKDMQTYN